MLLLGLVSPGRNCYSEAVGPKPQRMNMCCPMMIALTLLIVFFLGYVFGRWFRIDSGKGSWDGSGGCQHRNEVFDNDLDREGEVVFFMTRSGTKVHVSAKCHGLRNADPQFLIRKDLCKFCRKHGKTK